MYQHVLRPNVNSLVIEFIIQEPSKALPDRLWLQCKHFSSSHASLFVLRDISLGISAAAEGQDTRDFLTDGT